MPHPELQQEQAYVDNAYSCLDSMRSSLDRVQDAMATGDAAVAMEAWAKRRRKTFDDAERGLVFGRLTLDGTPRPLYIGRRWVHDDEHEPLVVNWQAPAARPFYTATPQEPQRVTVRRRYRTERRRLLDISDEALDGSAVDGASVSDFLLEELDRRREGRMRDIVATIQSDQYRLITAEPDSALVIQGGPGTGKTAVGLHRASWLLFTHREQLRRVLVVGPNPTFMDYVSHVLPALGEEAVEQRAMTELLGHRGRSRGRARRRAAQVGHAAARSDRARGRALREAGAGGARAVRGRRLRLGARARRARAARGGARLGSRATACARAVPHEPAPPLLRALRRAARAAGLPHLRRSRARAAAQRLPHEVPRPRASAAARRQARRAPAHVACGARGSGGGRPRPRRAEAAPARPAQARLRPTVERARPAAARRGARAARRPAARVRARDRR